MQLRTGEFYMFAKIVNKLFKYIPLKRKILEYLVIFTIIPIITASVFIFENIKANRFNEKMSLYKSNLQKCVHLVDMEYSTYIQRGNSIIGNNYLYLNIDRNFSGNVEEVLKFNQNVNVIFSAMESYEPSSISPFKIFTSNKSILYNKYIAENELLLKETAIQSLLKFPMNYVLWKIEEAQDDKQHLYVTFYRKLTSGKTSDSILKCSIPFKRIEYYLVTIGKPDIGQILYSDSSDIIIYGSSDNALLGKSLGDADLSSYHIMTNTLQNGHKITLLIPLNFMTADDIKALITIIIIVIVSLCIIICASIYTSNLITKGLDKFISTIQSDEKLLLNEEEININHMDEISFIKQRFKDAIKQINELHNDSLQHSKHISALELELLQSKINPHLLYNSLSVVKWSVLDKEDYATANLIDSLTRYYRLALNKGNNVLPVRQELDMIKEYVKINEVSRSSIYNLVINVEEKVMECYVIKHLLQPIIENSILHGFDTQFEKEKKISISATLNNNELIFEIEDNGLGMSEEKVQQLVSMDYHSNYGGYGVKNIIKRIHAYFGENYGLQIYSQQGHGTRVVIKIPSINKEELSSRLADAKI